jgi:hypothetical protein
VDDRLITVLGGEPARPVLDGAAGGRSGYWPRVWAARGLLHAWPDPATETSSTTETFSTTETSSATKAASTPEASHTTRSDAATAAIIGALADDAWRVREMAAKVVARHRIGVAFDAVAPLREDPIPRVRAAAHRAVVLLTASHA